MINRSIFGFHIIFTSFKSCKWGLVTGYHGISTGPLNCTQQLFPERPSSAPASPSPWRNWGMFGWGIIWELWHNSRMCDVRIKHITKKPGFFRYSLDTSWYKHISCCVIWHDMVQKPYAKQQWSAHRLAVHPVHSNNTRERGKWARRCPPTPAGSADRFHHSVASGYNKKTRSS